jgi:dTDP-4-dehydrorhamnose reductase
MNVLVLGATGMVGSMVFRKMVEHFGEDHVVGTYRNNWSKIDKLSGNLKQFSSEQVESWIWPFLGNGEKFDYVINCIGVIKPNIDEHSADSVANAIFVNSIFPRELAAICRDNGIRMIHVSTDCVFSGEGNSIGFYLENSKPDPMDVYGRSKALGECPEDCMVLRTSVIGEELETQKSLIEWVKQQEGQDVQGYGSHLWNGMTNLQFAKCCIDIMEKNWWRTGLFHLGGQYPVSKHDLLEKIASAFDIQFASIELVNPPKVDRCLASLLTLGDELCLPTIETQLSELVLYSSPNKK